MTITLPPDLAELIAANCAKRASPITPTQFVTTACERYLGFIRAGEEQMLKRKK